MKTFEVNHNDKTVGTVQMDREGAFYKYFAECRLDDCNYRLMLKYNQAVIPLQMFIPKGRVMVCLGRIPFSVIAENDVKFFIASLTDEQFVLPVESGTTFAYLDKLENSYFVMLNKPKICFQCDPGSTSHQQKA